MSFTKYDTYKPSEIDLLTEIPKGWNVGRLKALGDIRYGLGQPPKQIENGLPIIRATNVSFGKITTKDMLFVDPKDLSYDRKPILKTNEIIVVRSGAYTGDSAIIPKEYAGSVTGYDMVFTPKYINPKFIAFSILSNYIFKDQLVIASLRAAQPHLNKEELGNTLVSIPPFSEQAVIATYLDRQTSAIDGKVALLEQKITHYQQLRKSLINETVCHGLDKNVKLKDSGIEWIGIVPEHWKLKRLKDLSKRMGSGATPLSNIPSYYENGILNWVNTGDLNDGLINDCQYMISQHAIHDYPNLKTNKKGTLLIAMYGATICKIGLLNIEATTNQACCCINFKRDYLSKFVFYWFLANKNHIISLSVGGTQPNISQGIISKLLIVIPSLSEQTAISFYLDEKTQKIDSIVSNIKSQIETLKELRKTLINDVVTGKIKVTA